MFRPLVKQEDRKQRHPKPNQRLDFAVSLHRNNSHIICPRQSNALSSPTFSSAFHIPISKSPSLTQNPFEITTTLERKR